MLKKAQLGYQQITESTDAFPLQKWVQAKFVNRGNKPVRIFNDLYEPMEIFDASVGDHEVVAEIPIQFADDEDNPKVTVTYGILKDC